MTSIRFTIMVGFLLAFLSLAGCTPQQDTIDGSWSTHLNVMSPDSVTFEGTMTLERKGDALTGTIRTEHMETSISGTLTGEGEIEIGYERDAQGTPELFSLTGQYDAPSGTISGNFEISWPDRPEKEAQKGTLIAAKNE